VLLKRDQLCKIMSIIEKVMIILVFGHLDMLTNPDSNPFSSLVGDWILQPILSLVGDWILQPILSLVRIWILKPILSLVGNQILFFRP
jgi:hypothetical protein